MFKLILIFGLLFFLKYLLTLSLEFSFSFWFICIIIPLLIFFLCLNEIRFLSPLDFRFLILLIIKFEFTFNISILFLKLLISIELKLLLIDFSLNFLFLKYILLFLVNTISSFFCLFLLSLFLQRGSFTTFLTFMIFLLLVFFKFEVFGEVFIINFVSKFLFTLKNGSIKIFLYFEWRFIFDFLYLLFLLKSIYIFKSSMEVFAVLTNLVLTLFDWFCWLFEERILNEVFDICFDLCFLEEFNKEFNNLCCGLVLLLEKELENLKSLFLFNESIIVGSLIQLNNKSFLNPIFIKALLNKE